MAFGGVIFLTRLSIFLCDKPPRVSSSHQSRFTLFFKSMAQKMKTNVLASTCFHVKHVEVHRLSNYKMD